MNNEGNNNQLAVGEEEGLLNRNRERQRENNQNNQNFINNRLVENNHISELRSKDILDISKDFFPSLISAFFISLALHISENYCDPVYPLILKNCLYFNLAFLTKSILQIMFKFLKSPKHCQHSLFTLDYIANISYYLFVIFSFYSYKKLPDNCFYLNTYATVIIFSIITLGIIDICRNILSFILILIGFPMMIYYFFKDPADFMARFGVDHDIIDNLPTVKASSEQVSVCVICSEDIREGMPILVLSCRGKHYYHDTCIKEWLKVKLNCPVCRSNNVL